MIGRSIITIGVDMERLDRYFKQITDAVGLLHSNSMFVQAVTLTYVYMDHMSWLTVDGKKHSPHDFKKWVDDYMISKNPFGCNSTDLWEARNSVIHMGTAESDKFQERKAKRIHYYRRTHSPTPLVNDLVFVDVDHLIMSFLTGVMIFRIDLEKDVGRTSIVEGKLNKLLMNELGPTL